MSAKDLIVRPVSAKDANALVKRLHYSGKVTQNSQMHFGVFWRGSLEGAMQIGPPIDKRRMARLVTGSGWHEFTELNRMAFSDRLPRNSESRALGVMFRLLRKHAKQLGWVVSFSDAAQCGDGTIYRASGFVLTGIKRNNSLWGHPTTGEVRAQKSFDNYRDAAGRMGSVVAREQGWRPIPGYQLRYVRFLRPGFRERLSVPEVPFDQIPDNVRMYRGARRPVEGPGVQPGAGGANPTSPLHTPEDDG